MKLNKMNWQEVIPCLYKDSKETQAAFEPIISRILAKAPTCAQRRFVHMLGLPGAGKTTFWKKNKKKFSDCLFIGFDDLIQELPAYHKDVAELGLKKAFARWEIPARIAGYELLTRALKQGYGIFFDHGGSPKLHLALMNEAQKQGYRTVMYYLKCDINTALERAAAREAEIQRHTPQELILKRFPLVEQRAEEFRQIVDEFIEV